MKKISDSPYATYSNHRVEPYFTFVKNGQKTIEGRIKKGLYATLVPGDHIIVQNEEETDSVEVVVLDLRTYASIEEMLTKESFKKLLPEVESIEEGVNVYRHFYSEEQEKEFGVVAIAFERFI